MRRDMGSRYGSEYRSPWCRSLRCGLCGLCGLSVLTLRTRIRLSLVFLLCLLSLVPGLRRGTGLRRLGAALLESGRRQVGPLRTGHQAHFLAVHRVSEPHYHRTRQRHRLRQAGVLHERALTRRVLEDPRAALDVERGVDPGRPRLGDDHVGLVGVAADDDPAGPVEDPLVPVGKDLQGQRCGLFRLLGHGPIISARPPALQRGSGTVKCL